MVLSTARVDRKFSPSPNIILVDVDSECPCLQQSPSSTTSASNHRQLYGIRFWITMNFFGRTWSWGTCTCSATWTLTCPDTTPKLEWNMCPCSCSTHQWVFSRPRSHPCTREEVFYVLEGWWDSLKYRTWNVFPKLHMSSLEHFDGIFRAKITPRIKVCCGH